MTMYLVPYVLGEAAEPQTAGGARCSSAHLSGSVTSVAVCVQWTSTVLELVFESMIV